MYETASTISAAADKLHEQDLRIADPVAHLNAEQAKVARMAAENERLKTDFDAAVADIKHNDNPCATRRNESNWQWRGPQEAGEGETE